MEERNTQTETAMKPHSQVTVLAGQMSEHTCSHVHTPVGTLILKHLPPELELYMRERVTVLSQVSGREGEREGERERERGRRGEGMLLTHFHSGSCRPLQWSSTLRPAPLSQSHWLS